VTLLRKNWASAALIEAACELQDRKRITAAVPWEVPASDVAVAGTSFVDIMIAKKSVVTNAADLSQMIYVKKRIDTKDFFYLH
jgi:hypothetical protein